MRSSFSMFLLYHAYVYLEFLILACTIYILAPGDVVATLEPDVEKESVGSSKEKSVSAILENNSYNGIISDVSYDVTPNFELQSVLLAPTLKRKTSE
jgi:hypothetical protein